MKKEYSIRRLFFMIIFITLLLLSTTAVAYCVSSFSSYSDQALERNAANLDKYAENLDRELSYIRDRIRTLVYTDTNFTLLALTNYPDSKKIPIYYTVQESIRNITPSFGITMLYESRTNRTYFHNGSSLVSNDDFFLRERAALANFRENILLSDRYPLDHWFVSTPDEDLYLTYVCGSTGGAYVCAFLNLTLYESQALSPADSDESAVILYSGDYVLANESALTARRVTLSDVSTGSENVESVFQKGHLIQKISLPDCSLGISVVTPIRVILRKVLPQITFAVVMIGLTIIIILLMSFAMRRMLLFPLQEIAQFSNSLEEGVPNKPAEPSRIREFNEIRTSLEQLLEKQAELEQERLTKEQAREHAALQYYQLQTRSHFFLNCLKSLYNMSENNQIPKMQAMILAFSNHLRYIFHDNLMTVPMESELREVTDYHRIILLDYSRIFILTQNVPAEFMNVEVPPLLVQTFLENTYKYNSKTGEPLVFEISAEKEDLGGRPFMKLTLSDNGNGYSEEVLAKINEELTGSYDQFNVGINNLRRRLAILYKGACRTEFMNLPEGGACSVIHIPLEAEDDTDKGEL